MPAALEFGQFVIALTTIAARDTRLGSLGLPPWR